MITVKVVYWPSNDEFHVFGCGVEDGLYVTAKSWKTAAGAKRWAEKNGLKVVYIEEKY